MTTETTTELLLRNKRSRLNYVNKPAYIADKPSTHDYCYYGLLPKGQEDVLPDKSARVLLMMWDKTGPTATEGVYAENSLAGVNVMIRMQAALLADKGLETEIYSRPTRRHSWTRVTLD